MLQASKNEARLAVDLYNRSGNERQLEAFVVHMNLAWLKLLQAATVKDKGDLYVRNARGHRVRHSEDGGWTHRGLASLLNDYFDAQDAARRNVEFFLSIRNRIEHRHEKDIAALVSGKTQALLLNYEKTLVRHFGSSEGLAQELRFPLFMSVLTDSAVDAAKRVRAQVPKGVLEWIEDFETGMPADVLSDQAYEFRVHLVPKTGPKSTADASMTFIRADELTDEQTDALEKFQTIIRDKFVPVEDLGNLRPNDVVRQVNKRVPTEFTMHAHTQAWHFYQVRPASKSSDPARTKSDFCRYNEVFQQYTYTPAWVDYLVRKFSDAGTAAEILSWRPSTTANGVGHEQSTPDGGA
jgi:hypothetical protein